MPDCDYNLPCPVTYEPPLFTKQIDRLIFCKAFFLFFDDLFVI